MHYIPDDFSVSDNARQLLRLWQCDDFTLLDEGKPQEFVIWAATMMDHDLQTLIGLIQNADLVLDIYRLRLEGMGFDGSLADGSYDDLFAALGNPAVVKLLFYEHTGVQEFFAERLENPYCIKTLEHIAFDVDDFKLKLSLPDDEVLQFYQFFKTFKDESGIPTHNVVQLLNDCNWFVIQYCFRKKKDIF